MMVNATVSPDPTEAVVQIGRFMIEVDTFPVFFIPHFIIASLMVREDSKDLGPRFHQNHPFASWLSTILTGLAGVFVVNFLFGDPLIDVMKEDKLILFLTIIWYLMNYCPFDLVYKIARLPVVYLAMSVFQESLRLRCIYLGLQQAAAAYPGAYTIILLGGVVNGNGYGYLKIVERLIRGKWTPNTNEILEVTYFAKSSLYASAALLLLELGFLPAPVEMVYIAILGVFVVFRWVITLTSVKDPLLPIETPLCWLLFGAGDAKKKVAAAGGRGDASDKKKQ